MSQEMFASCRKSKKGSAIVFALLALAVMLVVAVGSFSVSMVDQKSAIDTEKSVSAFQAADSGIEIVMQIINKEIKANGGRTTLDATNLCNAGGSEYVDDFSLTGREISVEFIDSAGEKITNCSASTLSDIASIKSTGEYGGTRRAVQVGLDSGCPTGEIADIYDPTIKYEAITAADGKCWLDRNLGASRIATSYNDSQSYGWYFQWGRAADGHQLLSSSTTPTLSSNDNPGHGNFILGTNPLYFDWMSPQASDENNLWDGSRKNNPCPIGFHVPLKNEWNNLINDEGIADHTMAFTSSLKLSKGGYRSASTGSYYERGTAGYYWASDATDASTVFVDPTAFRAGGYFRISSSAVATYNYYRGGGFLIRCIED